MIAYRIKHIQSIDQKVTCHDDASQLSIEYTRQAGIVYYMIFIYLQWWEQYVFVIYKIKIGNNKKVKIFTF